MREKTTQTLPSGATLTTETGEGFHMVILEGPLHEAELFTAVLRIRSRPSERAGENHVDRPPRRRGVSGRRPGDRETMKPRPR